MLFISILISIECNSNSQYLDFQMQLLKLKLIPQTRFSRQFSVYFKTLAITFFFETQPAEISGWPANIEDINKLNKNQVKLFLLSHETNTECMMNQLKIELSSLFGVSDADLVESFSRGETKV